MILWRQQVSRYALGVRGDSLVALGVPLGCIALLVEAYTRTELADAETSAACYFPPTSALIQPFHVRQLEKDGIVVIPNALSAEELTNSRLDVINFSKSKSFFQRSSNDADVRQDSISWVKAYSDQEKNYNSPNTSWGDHLSHCVNLVRGVAKALEDNDYSGSREHLVPQECQLALYRGDDNSVYHRHLDRCNKTIYELGLLEWLRLSDYRERAVTVILYLNLPDRHEQEGGALRCWVKSGMSSNQNSGEEGCNENFNPPFNILPKGGTMVIFKSALVEHMVLPSSTDRYALTSWVSGAI